MSPFETVQGVLSESGLWSHGRAQTHGFLLSPSCYEITESQRLELEKLGEVVHQCLAGVGRIFATAVVPGLTEGGSWGLIAKALRNGVPKVYESLQCLRPSRVPAICKVDLMLGADGRFYIAEIDGHNKHGLGYSILAARLRRSLRPEAKALPGAARLLAEDIWRRHGAARLPGGAYEPVNGASRLYLLYADQERFYAPEFEILRSELATLGIDCRVFSESQAAREGLRNLINHHSESNRLLVDLPFLFKSDGINQELAAFYQAGTVDFLIPPKPFLGAKAVLALLRNDERNVRLEAILHSQIKPEVLELVRRYIPETYLLHRNMDLRAVRERCQRERFVLKESISSGMKGTLFSDDERFDFMLERACSSYYRFVLQREVENQAQTFAYFTETGAVKEDQWYTRVTAHYAVRRLADIIVTARRDKKVHGAKDCLQLGTVII